MKTKKTNNYLIDYLSDNTESYFENEYISIDYTKYKGRGGSFIITPIDTADVFSKENFTEEHKMFESAAREFAEKRIKPNSEKLNKLNKDLSLQIFKEMGELGFLGVDVPEEYGGLGLDKTTSSIIVDALSAGRNASIMVTMSAHTGIAMLPLIWYGNSNQKKKYLPKMVTGEYMGCYALTEPNAGSDALSGETTAKLNNKGTHYILNGQKIYVTNGGWADIAITFAKVDEKYTCFIIDKTCDGWVVGDEEDKMGIKGSSTVTYYFENCSVPKENILGEVGMGSAIAFNVLYVGRYKLGVTTNSGSKYVLEGAFEFSKERRQFGKTINEFGMIKKKFANMVVRSFEGDCVNYATTGSIDYAISMLDKNAKNYFHDVQQIIEDHGIEASICKIVGSESFAYVVDEGVQILGGAGFIEDYPLAASYRDERINRIFEGTNEINRVIIGSLTLKKTILEELPVRDMINLRLNDWIPDLVKDSMLGVEPKIIEFSRSCTLFCLHKSILTYGQDLKNEQWILEPLSDMIISLFILDTCYKRFINIKSKQQKIYMLSVIKLSIADQYEKIIKNAKDLIISLNEKQNKNDDLDTIDKWIAKLSYRPNRIELQQNIANDLYEKNKYYLDV